MTAKQKKMIFRIAAAAVLYVPLFVGGHMGVFGAEGWKWPLFAAYLGLYALIAYDIVGKAARNICHGQVFDENFLMMIATFGAFGVGEYAEAVAVMLFYQVGEFFQGYAVGKSRKSISDLMDICPEYANVEIDGELVQVDPDEVGIGETIVVKPGERVPLDGIVEEGESFLDTAALTGEPVPRKVSRGGEIISGCINGSGTLRVRVSKEFEDSTVSRILELVENASAKKADVENFITRFARYYTPAVTVFAALLAVFPPLFLGAGWGGWIQRACIFLVISCPCALVISVPLGFFGGIGASSKIGVLVKGSNYLEAVAEMTAIVFDKTGTLTKGEFRVSGIVPGEITGDAARGQLSGPAADAEVRELLSGPAADAAPQELLSGSVKKGELLELAAHAEAFSTHPIGASIREAYGGKLELERLGDAVEIAGQGIRIPVDGMEMLVGNERLMREQGISYRAQKNDAGTVVYVAREKQFLGAIVISDALKDGAGEAVKSIKQMGVKKCIMLTGDRAPEAEYIAKKLGIDEVYAELLPGEKVEQTERLLEKQRKGEKLAFVGDGINDAPVLTRADVGIAMGSLGSDAAIEAADVVIMDDDIRKIAKVVQIARKTLTIVKQNIVFSLAVKAAVLILGACGLANMWEAVFADVGVSVIAILNSMRMLYR